MFIPFMPPTEKYILFLHQHFVTHTPYKHSNNQVGNFGHEDDVILVNAVCCNVYYALFSSDIALFQLQCFKNVIGV